MKFAPEERSICADVEIHGYKPVKLERGRQYKQDLCPMMTRTNREAGDARTMLAKLVFAAPTSWVCKVAERGSTCLSGRGGTCFAEGVCTPGGRTPCLWHRAWLARATVFG